MRRRCLQVEGARENRGKLWEKGRGLAVGLRAPGSGKRGYGGRVTLSPPTWLPCLTPLYSLFSFPGHDEDLGHLPVDCPLCLQ